MKPVSHLGTSPIRTDAPAKVRYHGEPVAVVVADDEAAAQHALRLVKVEYAPLPALGSPRER